MHCVVPRAVEPLVANAAGIRRLVSVVPHVFYEDLRDHILPAHGALRTFKNPFYAQMSQFDVAFQEVLGLESHRAHAARVGFLSGMNEVVPSESCHRCHPLETDLAALFAVVSRMFEDVDLQCRLVSGSESTLVARVDAAAVYGSVVLEELPLYFKLGGTDWTLKRKIWTVGDAMFPHLMFREELEATDDALVSSIG